MYSDLAEIARRHGYALAVHGSLARDFDSICVPWTEKVSCPSTVVVSMESEFAVKRIGLPSLKQHGREVWTLSIGFGECFFDLSFMPQIGRSSKDGGDAP